MPRGERIAKPAEGDPARPVFVFDGAVPCPKATRRYRAGGSMTAPSTGRLIPPLTFALLLACTADSDAPLVGLQPMSFANSEWSEPVHLDAPVNSRCQDQTPTLPKDDLGWGPPTPLGPNVNTTLHEAGPFYSQSAEDGSANLYFYRGSDNGATTDIYYAAVTRDGETRGPAVLVSELSYPGRPDGFVTVRADGKEILFNSGRPLTPGGANAFDIWVATRRSTHDAWSAPVNLGPPVNTTFAEFQPDLSHDGRTLLFIAGVARGGLGGFDIWMSTRTVNGKEEP